MKKGISIFLFFLFLVGFSACDGFLDKPKKDDLVSVNCEGGVVAIDPVGIDLNKVKKGQRIKFLVVVPKGHEIVKFEIDEEPGPSLENNKFELDIEKSIYIKVEVSKKKLNLTLENENLSVLNYSEDKLDEIPWGTSLRVQLATPDKKALDSFTVNNRDKMYLLENSIYEFVIEEDTNINATFVDGYSLTLGENLSVIEPENLDINHIKAGTNVVIKADLSECKAVEKFVVNSVSDTDIDYEYREVNEDYDFFAQKEINNISEDYIVEVSYLDDSNVPPANCLEIDTYTDLVKLNSEAQNITFENVLIPNCIGIIDSKAFKDNSNVLSVTISDTVVSIKSWAFYGCVGITSIEIPNSVEDIGYYAFNGCSGLQSIVLPNALKSIMLKTFESCIELKSIEIPGSVSLIGRNAFSGCSKLQTVDISEGVLSIGQNSFEDCSKLETIDIPSTVSSIGNYAFSGCSGLNSIVLNEGLETIKLSAFQNCNQVSSIVIPNTVTDMGVSVFRGWNSNSIINCRAPEKPAGWAEFWNPDNITVNWNY